MSKYVHVCYGGPNSKRTKPATSLVIAFGHMLTKRIHVVVASRTPFVIQNFAQLPLYATILIDIYADLLSHLSNSVYVYARVPGRLSCRRRGQACYTPYLIYTCQH
jgi:hypothetical protein